MTKQQTILILGSGFAGLRCALDLADRIGRRPDVRIILVDKESAQVVHARLYEVAAAKVPREVLCLPIDAITKNRPLTFIQDRVVSLDPLHQEVKLHRTGVITYNYLVIALGSVPNDYGISGLTDHAFFFGTFDQALRLRQAITHHGRHHSETKVVIGGGGPTGVEIAASLHYHYQDLLPAKLKNKHKLSVEIIELAPHLLGNLSPKIQQGTERYLRRHHVKLRFGQAITRVTDETIVLANKSVVPYDLFVWTGGVKPNPVINHSGFLFDKSGKILTSPTLQARGFAKVYVAGDTAAFTGPDNHSLPAIAPYAFWQGGHIAANIARQILGNSPIPFKPPTAPIFIPLGEDRAFLSYGGLSLGGRWILTLRLLVDFYYLAGLLPIGLAWRLAFTDKHLK